MVLDLGSRYFFLERVVEDISRAVGNLYVCDMKLPVHVSRLDWGPLEVAYTHESLDAGI
jgi:hypothetical protein